MDHSVEGYLRRRSVAELEQVLEEFIKERGEEPYDMYIDIILQILKERNGGSDEKQD